MMGMKISDLFELEVLKTLHEWMFYSDMIRLAGNSFVHTCSGNYGVGILMMRRLRNLGTLHKPRSGKPCPPQQSQQQQSQ